MERTLPLLGMGTWGMGGKYERDEKDVAESVELLSYGFDLGFRLVDVAELYGEGQTEIILGKALQGRKREDIFVVSKVWKEHLRYDEVLKAAEGSLQRLDTSYIDLYLVHWPNPVIPLKETMSAMEALVEKGLVKEIGVSNFSVPLMEEAQSYLSNTRIFANEVEYNLAVRDVEKEIIPFCEQRNIKVIAYRPLGKGTFLSGANTVLPSLASKYKKTTAQIALNWIIGKGICAIPKAGSREHLKEDFGALGWHPSTEDNALLDASRF